ncbi:MAG TPA: ATP-binding protein, partial [Burkholderiaceae bacterium]|nr:ATP-binding protein [Burkholderiaceae bacterium]
FAERELRASEARSRLALDVAQLGTWSWRGADNELCADARFCELCGVSPDAPVSYEALMARVHADDRAAVDAAVREALSPSGEGRFRAEVRCVQPDGSLRWLVARGLTEFAAIGSERRPSRMLGTAMDVTARKRTEHELLAARDDLEARVRERTAELARANAALRVEIAEREAAGSRIRQLLGRLVDAQEQERRRLSRELHDTLGQHLAVLTMGLTAVRTQPGSPPQVTQRLGDIEQAAQRLEDEVDRLSYELRPLALDHLGLVDALGQYADEWSAQGGIAVDLQVHGLPAERLSAAVEATVYRVVQEALTNVRKHAAASRVSLIAERRGSQLRVIVEDDGRGFDAAAVSAFADGQRRLGLLGMSERAALVTGVLEVESSPGYGTTIYLTVPLDVGDPAATAPNHDKAAHPVG